MNKKRQYIKNTFLVHTWRQFERGSLENIMTQEEQLLDDVRKKLINNIFQRSQQVSMFNDVDVVISDVNYDAIYNDIINKLEYIKQNGQISVVTRNLAKYIQQLSNIIERSNIYDDFISLFQMIKDSTYNGQSKNELLEHLFRDIIIIDRYSCLLNSDKLNAFDKLAITISLFEEHSTVMFIDKANGIYYFFDPSHNENSYKFILGFFLAINISSIITQNESLSNYIIKDIHDVTIFDGNSIQGISSSGNFMDLYCQIWIVHFIKSIIVDNIDPNDYYAYCESSGDLLELIKTFMVDYLNDSDINEIYTIIRQINGIFTGGYMRKYLKYFIKKHNNKN